MDTEQPRYALAWSALAGGAFWGLFHVTTALLASQSPTRRDWILLGANVMAAALMGSLLAFFVAPAVIPLIPWVSMRDPQALGFGIGATCWELAPFAYRFLRSRAEAEVNKEAGK